ncbi:MAG: 1-acyl-sn-glycerol-3-phosphate acyltransferase [Aureibaculum sp.]|jgi:1-acyl-sn-glycerol-3-phosphate acyltransferase
MGWKIINDFPKLDKFLIIAAPHTSWQDFPIALLAKYATSLKANYIGKDSLFKPPFGFIFRWLGGAPVNRSKNTNLVQAIVDIYNSKDRFVLGMSPEGTRQKVDQWKTGFYYIAKGAKIPIVMATIDFGNKQLKISEPYYVTDDMESDFKHFHSYFEGVKGKHPELS